MADHQTGPKPHPARAQIAQSHDHEKPVWLWLGIGVLLGVGATLLSSSLWLPKGGDVDLVQVEAGEQVATSAGVASASEATPSTSNIAEEVTPKPPEADVVATVNDASPTSLANAETEATSAADGGEQLDVETRLVALEVDDEALQPPVNGASQNGVTELADTSKTEADRDQTGGELVRPASDAPLTTERLLPAEDAKPESLEGVEVTAVDAGPDLESGLANDAEALAPLSTAPVTPEEPVADRSGSSEPDALSDISSSDDRAEPKPPAPAADAGENEVVDRTELAVVTPAVASNPGPPSATDPREGGRLYRVQLAAVANEAAARVYWREVNERLPGVFDDVEPVFDERVVDQRLYLRVWVGSFGLRGEADSYCSWLKEKGQDCFVTRVDNL
jgi:hypothetical protein